MQPNTGRWLRNSIALRACAAHVEYPRTALSHGKRIADACGRSGVFARSAFRAGCDRSANHRNSRRAVSPVLDLTKYLVQFCQNRRAPRPQLVTLGCARLALHADDGVARCGVPCGNGCTNLLPAKLPSSAP